MTVTAGRGGSSNAGSMKPHVVLRAHLVSTWGLTAPEPSCGKVDVPMPARSFPAQRDGHALAGQ